MLTGEIKGKRHFIYESPDEFLKETGLKYKYWKKSPKKGDWVQSDDGGILQILKYGNLNHHGDTENYKSNKGYVRTVVGSFLINENSYMDTDFSQHPNRYTFSKKIKNSNENFSKRENITINEKLFITDVVSGKDAVTAVQNVYGTEDYKKAKHKAFALLKQDRVMNEIEKGVIDVAKGLGINHEYVLTTLKNLADRSDDDNVILQSAKELGKIIGTSGKIIKQRDVGLVGMFGGFSPEQLEEAQRAIAPLEIKNEMP